MSTPTGSPHPDDQPRPDPADPYAAPPPGGAPQQMPPDGQPPQHQPGGDPMQPGGLPLGAVLLALGLWLARRRR